MNRSTTIAQATLQRARGGNADRIGRDRWLLSYADLVTLLFACFTTAYASSYVPPSAPLAPLASAVAPIGAMADRPVASAVAPIGAMADRPVAPDNALRDLIAPLVINALGDADVDLVEDRRGLVISLPVSATFASGSATLTREAEAFLRRLAEVLGPTSAELRIEGHTDDVPVAGGRFGSNWELSTARASAVVLFLLANATLVPERLSAAGYGEFHPRTPNDTPERRALNRRVDVVVTEPQR